MNKSAVLDRLKLTRKQLKYTQEEFAKRINMSRSNLGNIETGDVKLTPRVISDICSAFSVNEEWLLTGEGEQFITPSIEEQAYMRFGKLMENSSPSKRNFISMLLKIVDELPDDAWSYIYDEFKACVELTEKEKKNS